VCVMSPVDYAYLDFYQGDPAVEPPHMQCSDLIRFILLNLSRKELIRHTFWRSGKLVDRKCSHFPAMLNILIWPRSFALAEVFWSPKIRGTGRDLFIGLEINLDRLKKKDINFSTSFYDAIIEPSKDEQGNLLISLSSEIEGLKCIILLIIPFRTYIVNCT